ncbi:MAG TPA: hypothetical protein VFG69_05095, partial [Nannocystaceae bacterium]|nr:hypothetical protein [Nannocystaceae bacterium]
MVEHADLESPVAAPPTVPAVAMLACVLHDHTVAVALHDDLLAAVAEHDDMLLPLGFALRARDDGRDPLG